MCFTCEIIYRLGHSKILYLPFIWNIGLSANTNTETLLNHLYTLPNYSFGLTMTSVFNTLLINDAMTSVSLLYKLPLIFEARLVVTDTDTWYLYYILLLYYIFVGIMLTMTWLWCVRGHFEAYASCNSHRPVRVHVSQSMSMPQWNTHTWKDRPSIVNPKCTLYPLNRITIARSFSAAVPKLFMARLLWQWKNMYK